jgi:hypothetical protein
MERASPRPARRVDRMVGKDVKARLLRALGRLRLFALTQAEHLAPERQRAYALTARIVAVGRRSRRDHTIVGVDCVHGRAEGAQELAVELRARRPAALGLGHEVVGEIGLIPSLEVAHPRQPAKAARVARGDRGREIPDRPWLRPPSAERRGLRSARALRIVGRRIHGEQHVETGGTRAGDSSVDRAEVIGGVRRVARVGGDARGNPAPRDVDAHDPGAGLNGPVERCDASGLFRSAVARVGEPERQVRRGERRRRRQGKTPREHPKHGDTERGSSALPSRQRFGALHGMLFSLPIFAL